MSATLVPSAMQRLLRENVVFLLLAMLVVIPLLGPFTHGSDGRSLRTILLQSTGVLLLLVLLARTKIWGGGARILALLQSGVSAPLAALLLWAVVGAARAPDPNFALHELLRLGTGALVCFTVALHLENRTQLRLLLDGLLGIAIFVLGYGLITQGSTAAGFNPGTGGAFSSVFTNRLQLGAVLAVLLPLFAVLSFSGEEPKRRLAAITAAILCATGLLMTMERGPWCAAAVGLVVAALPALGAHPRCARVGAKRRRASIAILGLGLLIAVGFFTVTDLDANTARRAQTIAWAVRGRDASLSWRVRKWQGAAAMALDRPLWGWGPGQFVLHQQPYTRIGRGAENVARYGATFDDMAFNEYLQTAAELGFPGLALYLLVLISFASKAWRAAGRLPHGVRRTVLLGCLGGVGAYAVDALGNVSWRYIECDMFFWLLLGLGMAIVRMAYESGSQLTAHDKDVGL